jgi:hypothetical protein
MASVPLPLVADLRYRLNLRRVVETGTFRGDGTAALGSIFPHVVSIELSLELHEAATRRFAGDRRVDLFQGDSGELLSQLVDASVPTLYFLDAHRSGGETAGAEIDCPILDELRGLEGAGPTDCIIIDDARVFTEGPPAPRDRSKWPPLGELTELLRKLRPGHYVTVVGDHVVAVPARARPVVDVWSETPPHRSAAAPRPALPARPAPDSPAAGTRRAAVTWN